MKLLTVVGARPQFVKAAVVSSAIRRIGHINEEIVHTGQHYDPDMSDVFFKEMGIPQPVANLHVGSGTHAQTTADMLKGLEHEILQRRPDKVLVYGDTNSTLAGALAAVKLGIPIAHVEAGQRSFDRSMPEEVNRVLTDHISALLFCCSAGNVALLAKEGITRHVHNVGDVMMDAFIKHVASAQWPEGVTEPSAPFVLSTIHRASNTDHLPQLKAVLKGLESLEMPVLLPLHPRSAKAIENAQLRVSPNIQLLPPLPYSGLLALLVRCKFVVTDSGGLQKEAYYAGKRCVVLRQESEWIELVEAGCSMLVGADSGKILAAKNWAVLSSDVARGIYGQGDAAEKIAALLAT